YRGTNSIRVWEAVSQREQLSLESGNQRVALGFSADSKSLFVLNVAPWSVEVYSKTKQSMERSVALEDAPPPNSVPGFGADPAQALLAVSTQDTLNVWDLLTGRKLASLALSNQTMMGFLFARNPSAVIGLTRDRTAGAEAPFKVHFWDPRSLRLLKVIPLPGYNGNSPLLSPDGKWFAASSGPRKTIDLWDASTGQRIA